MRPEITPAHIHHVFQVIDAEAGDLQDFDNRKLRMRGEKIAPVVRAARLALSKYAAIRERDYRLIDYTRRNRRYFRRSLSIEEVGKLVPNHSHPWRHHLDLAERYTGLPDLFQPGMSYFPLGDFPGMVTLSTHHQLKEAFLEGVGKLMLEHRRRISFLMVGDEAYFFNACYHLGRYDAVNAYREYAKNGTRDFDILDIEEKMKTVGVRDRMAIHAAQVAILNDPNFFERAERVLDPDDYYEVGFSGLYIPTVLMSDIVNEHPKIRELFCELADLTEESDEFLAMLWQCVPPKRRQDIFKNLRLKLLGLKSEDDEESEDEVDWSEEEIQKRADKLLAYFGEWDDKKPIIHPFLGPLTEVDFDNIKDIFSPKNANKTELRKVRNLSSIEKRWMRQSVGYALMQTAFVLYWGGIKNGHFKGEAGFDKIATFCLGHFRQRIAAYLPDKDVGFCYLDQTNDGFTDEPIFYSGKLYCGPAKGAMSVASAEKNNIDALIHDLRENTQRYLPFFAAFLRTIDQTTYLEERQREPLLCIETFKLLQGLVDTFLMYPEFEEVLRESGLQAFFSKRIPLYDLENRNRLPLEMGPINRALAELATDLSNIRRKFNQDQVRLLGRHMPSGYRLECKGINALSARKWLAQFSLFPDEGIEIFDEDYIQWAEQARQNPANLELLKLLEEVESEEWLERDGAEEYAERRPLKHLRGLVQAIFSEGSSRSEAIVNLFDFFDKPIAEDPFERLYTRFTEFQARFRRGISEASFFAKVAHLEEHFEDYLLARCRPNPYHVGKIADQKEQKLRGYVDLVDSGTWADLLYRFRLRRGHNPQPSGYLKPKADNYETASAYMIRIMSQVLSGPMSKYPELAETVDTIFKSLFHTIYPHFELNATLHMASWPYDEWKASKAQTSSQ